MKRTLSFLIACLICVNYVLPVTASAVSNPLSTELQTQPEECDLSKYSKSETVSSANVQEIIRDNQLPIEVARRLVELSMQEDGNQQITIYIPDDTVPDAELNGTSVSWSPTRIYNGYTLQNYVITIENAFNMTPIEKPSNVKTLLKYVGPILALVGDAIVDEFYPFASPYVTLLDFLIEIGQISSSDNIYAGDGDKLSAAPQYRTFDTYVYVLQGSDKLLGCRVFACYVPYIHWSYYNSAFNQYYSGSESYPLFSVKSQNYDNQNLAAIQNFNLGGQIDEVPSIKIGDKRFVLR